MKSALVASLVPPTSTRLRYSEISSRAPLSRRPRGPGVYFPTPGTSRANADDAAAVMGLIGVACGCAACEWPARPEEEEEEDARKKGSKCSFSRSNSSESGAESSNFCNCAAWSRRETRLGYEKQTKENARMTLTREAGRLFERYVDLGRVPSAVVAVKEEGGLADCAQIGSERPAVVRVRWV
jgi:hypothetical protein